MKHIRREFIHPDSDFWSDTMQYYLDLTDNSYIDIDLHIGKTSVLCSFFRREDHESKKDVMGTLDGVISFLQDLKAKLEDV